MARKHELREACKKSEQVDKLAIPALNQPITQRLDALLTELETEWTTFDCDLRAGKLKHLHYDEQTQTLRSKKTKDNKAEKLQNRFYAQFPLRDITDILRFSDENSHLSAVFSHIQPRYAKLPLDKNSLYATLIAQAFNNGNLMMADISDISYSRLFDTYQSRIRLGTLRKGNDCIVNVMKNLPIFPFYSLDLLILYGGVDGQKYEVQTHTTKARHSKKYYKKGKGVVAYTLLVNHMPLLTQLSQNRIESYHQLRSAISQAYGKKQLIGKNDREIEITNECARLIANAIIHYNTAILSKLFVRFQAEGNHRVLARLKKISPVAWDHIHFQGHFIFNDEGTAIDLDEIVRSLVLK